MNPWKSIKKPYIPARRAIPEGRKKKVRDQVCKNKFSPFTETHGNVPITKCGTTWLTNCARASATTNAKYIVMKYHPANFNESKTNK